ncbi:DUF1178 family protein [Ideonella sp. A 288]|uniref:DUF1178 family protein n=1 Tax=Ideonella sp. A 288 TaxID=1962181 RepID=UPI000B4A803E|nr:DUF1178 family protein [Ideonella sp. A 288]
MKVLDLRCAHGHLFEGWFASEDDFLAQNGRGLIDCPLCADKVITRMPSAPRLNLGAVRPEQTPTPAAKPAEPDLQTMWLQAVQHVIANTEDVGRRFAEEARRIHYGEVEARGIRGQATPEERSALAEEGIEAVPLPMPAALKGPAH